MTHDLSSDLSSVERGWAVVGNDGAQIGEVNDVREDHVLVGRGLLHDDLHIPLDRIAGTGDGQLVVDVAGGDAGEQGWAHPPSASYEHARPAMPEVPETTMIEVSGYGAGRLASPEVQGMVRDDRAVPADEAAPGTDVSPDTEHIEDGRPG